ncbi:MAG: lipocalin [Deltaproteobacteria bacterium]|nr:lipocalin [Deltaproteobacteria bacterium]
MARALALLAATLFLVSGCLGVPEGITPVREFDIERYLGKWYEIARLDHSFERGLDLVTAEYSLREDGGVRVLNRGFSKAEGKWKEAEGRAYFVGDTDRGHLKVTFFWPFHASYVVFELDREEYGNALVTSTSRDYLWLLSRTPNPDPAVIERFMAQASEHGFDTGALIFVRHDVDPDITPAR